MLIRGYLLTRAGSSFLSLRYVILEGDRCLKLRTVCF